VSGGVAVGVLTRVPERHLNGIDLQDPLRQFSGVNLTVWGDLRVEIVNASPRNRTHVKPGQPSATMQAAVADSIRGM
jgi:hypothetical protein